MIKVLRSGLYTTIQDLGRFGYREYGVPLSGSMDQSSAIQANLILGNEPNSSVLEFLIKGPQLLFVKSCWICISGAPIAAMSNQKTVPMNMPFFVKANQLLDLGSISKGRYSYLAIKGGVLSEEIMGSMSFSKGITLVDSIRKDSIVKYGSSSKEDQFESLKLMELDFSSQIISVNIGPEFDNLSYAIQELLVSTTFKISNESSRMGYRLETTEELCADEIITGPVQPGTVQMTPSGQLIVLMRDAQTTGGYARVLQLNAESINLIAQKRVGEAISFNIRP